MSTITEIEFDPETKQFQLMTYTPVVVKDYGTEGYMAEVETDCPLFKPDLGCPSCVSGSGSSICSGFYGHIGARIIRCQENRPK